MIAQVLSHVAFTTITDAKEDVTLVVERDAAAKVVSGTGGCVGDQ
jgi:hypothetical protein